MELSCPLGTTRCIPQAKFHQKPYNKSFINQVCSVKMAGSRLRLGPWTRKKRTWPISSHLDLTLGQYSIRIVLNAHANCLANELTWINTWVSLMFDIFGHFFLNLDFFLKSRLLIGCFYIKWLFSASLLDLRWYGILTKLWWFSWKIQFLENTRFKTLEHLSKTLWNDLAKFSSRWVWNLTKVHSGKSSFT